MSQSWWFLLACPLCSWSLKTLCNLVQAAFMMQLLFTVMKKKTGWVSANCFSLKLEVCVEMGMLYHQNTLSGNVVLGTTERASAVALRLAHLSCPTWCDQMGHWHRRCHIPVQGCASSWRAGWCWGAGYRAMVSCSAAGHTSVCCWIRSQLCISLSKERARATLI